MFVVFNKETTVTFKTPYGSTNYFRSAGAAKAAITRMKKKLNAAAARVTENTFNRERVLELAKADFDFAEVSDFEKNIEIWVERKNLMSGKKFKERVNTPCYLSPASEAYWSM